MKTILTLLILLTIFSVNTFSQDVSHTILEGHTDEVWSISFSPDGLTLASGAFDRTIRLWDVRANRELHILSNHGHWIEDVSFSPDGQTLANASSDHIIRLWDVKTGREVRLLEGHVNYIKSVSFSPDGRMLASGSFDRTILLWDIGTGQYQVLKGHRGSVKCISFSPDGQMLASGSDDHNDIGIRLWDVSTCRQLQMLAGHTSPVDSVSFSPDGRTLASASRDHTIRLWDIETGQHQVLKGHRGQVESVSFSPDGRTLVSGSFDRTVCLWDVLTGQQRKVLTGHTSRVTSVSFSPDGRTLASGSYDRTIRLWELPSTRVSITPYPVESPSVGQQFTIDINVTDGEDIGGYQLTVVFDATALRYVESSNGAYLPSGAFFSPPVVEKNHITLGASSFTEFVNGDGTLATVTFETLNVRESNLSFSNVILIESDGNEYLPLLVAGSRVIRPTLSSSAIVSVMPSEVLSPAIRQQLVFNVDITRGKDVVNHQLTWEYDKTALKFISSNLGNYLDDGVGNGDGVLFSGTFEILSVKDSTVNVSGHFVHQDGFRYIPTFESAQVIAPLLGDVNRDGVVNILDLVLVASSFGQRIQVDGNPADVNEDGIVNIVDLVKVAGALNNAAAAPSLHSQAGSLLTATDVQQWLSQAQQSALTDATSQRGIRFLEQLLEILTPKETALLPNYPNPFNPETWIPYQLSEAAAVLITIYDVAGNVVRSLDLGDRAAGYYRSRSQAAYWDGRNNLNERVASGIYFYQILAGEFSATRRMLVLK